jgi:tRNA pseudouridine38-40 synthase
MYMKNIALRLRYTGTAYHGWQVQKNAATVQGTLEAAISKTVEHPVRLIGCGRTDAGVHARDYVANFHTNSSIPLDRLPLAINTRLPNDIVVKAAYSVPEEFNAINSCLKKEYTYIIYNSRIRDPFYACRACFYPRQLDEDVMRLAAGHFVGRHDFAALRSVGTDVKTTVRTVYYYEVERKGDIILLRVCADGFLYNMARAMAGTLVYVSEGKLRKEDIPKILESGDRTLAGPTMPPEGLYLTRLWYGPEVPDD